jgi:ATP-binding cassette subfamily B (MDR/TAP) protein 1
VGLIGAVASGIALAMTNVVLGRFMNLLSDINAESYSANYMGAVTETA